MRKIIVDKTPFLLDLSGVDTANYAEEDVVLEIKDGAQDIFFPEQSKVKGSPNIMLWVTSRNNLKLTFNFAAGEGIPATAAIAPAPNGLLNAFPIEIPQQSKTPICIGFKPVIEGMWWFTYFLTGK